MIKSTSNSSSSSFSFYVVLPLPKSQDKVQEKWKESWFLSGSFQVPAMFSEQQEAAEGTRTDFVATRSTGEERGRARQKTDRRGSWRRCRSLVPNADRRLLAARHVERASETQWLVGTRQCSCSSSVIEPVCPDNQMYKYTLINT